MFEENKARLQPLLQRLSSEGVGHWIGGQPTRGSGNRKQAVYHPASGAVASASWTREAVSLPGPLSVTRSPEHPAADAHAGRAGCATLGAA